MPVDHACALPPAPPSAVALLEAGLAKLHPAFDPYNTPGGQELEAAQAKARQKKLKVRLAEHRCVGGGAWGGMGCGCGSADAVASGACQHTHGC